MGERKTVRPGARALSQTQDRLVEKQFLRGLGLETAPFHAVEDSGSLVRAVAELGRPSILKTRRFGYDGKGQSMMREGSNVSAVYRTLGGGPMILEGFVNFEREVSVIAARSVEGDIAPTISAKTSTSAISSPARRLPARVAPHVEAEAKTDRRESARRARLCRRDRRRDVRRARA